MMLSKSHSTLIFRAASTLLILLFCVCSAVARDTTRVFSKSPWGENTAGVANGLGGAYVNTYNYDDLYRLTAANGSYAGNNTTYSLEMAYTPAGRLCGKIQDYTATANTYAYSQNAKPHAVRRYYNGITNELSNLRWDANGNLAQQTIYSVNNNVPTYQTMRMLFWDEDDRLNLVAGDGYLSYYTYGHDGNRAIKMTGNAAIDQSGMLLNSTNLENITIYPNEYLTVTQAEYTKYYYAGGNRIASKIGTGGFEKMTRLCTQDFNLSANANTLFGNALQQIVNITNQPNDEFPVNVCGGYSVAAELLADPLPDFYISQTNLNFTQNNLLQQFRQNLTNSVEPVYYFHSDHLGSASWITDGTGAAVQHLLYLPFGEPFVNEQIAAYSERFTFTGKERDAETGYYYHGARFNSSDIGWLGVDPQFEKLPSTTPYNYCLWNPIVLHDPDGEIPVETIWDILNVAYDLGAAAYCKIQGDDAGAKEHMNDAALDLVAVAIPYVPAGDSKVVRLASKGAKAVDKTVDAAKTTKQTANLLKNTKIVNWTKNNYRKGLQIRTGKFGKGFEAHHTLPQKFEKYFSKAGINIHDPENLVWRNPHKHHTKTHEQLERWKSFFDINPNATKQEILRERNKIEKDVFGNICGDLN